MDEQNQALVVREQNTAVDRALSIDEIKQRLDFIKTVMARNMTEGQDYGKIPGCGDKPGLFQPGAQKLALTFQLSPTVAREVLRELRSDHREYEFTLAISTGSGRILANGVGTCSTLESKYRYRGGSRKCPECGKESIIKGKKEFGGGWLCFSKKGGCGAKWADGDPSIEAQSVERAEHDNPADFWNTARKMAFKRALVHGMINATNTSELWSQDLEDIGENDHGDQPPPKQPQTKAPPPPLKPAGPPPPPKTDDLRSHVEKCKQRFIEVTHEHKIEIFAWDWAVRSGIIMKNEPLKDGSPAKFPVTKEEYEKAMSEIRMLQEAMTANGGISQELAEAYEAANMEDQIPGAEAPPSKPEAAPEMPSVDGEIAHISTKSGTSKQGPWTSFGIKIGEEWFNTFSKSLGECAQGLQGKAVTLYYEKTAKGNTAKAIRHEGKLTEASA